MRRRRLGLQQLDGTGVQSCFFIIVGSSESAVLGGLGMHAQRHLRPVRLDWRLGSREGGQSSTWARWSSVW
eukprot:COSAG06_NODE_36035_length_452_cov_1.617564_1_plen_70_part_10